MNTGQGVIRSAAGTVSTVFWTSLYFVYFLFKGKNEWKCDKLKKPDVTYCCVDGSKCFEHSNENGSRFFGKQNDDKQQARQRKETETRHVDNHNSTPKQFYTSHSGVRGFLESTWTKIKNASRTAWDFSKRIGRKAWHYAKSVGRFAGKLLLCLFALFKALFASNVPSQALPSTPKPFTTKQPASPNYNKVEFKFDPNQANLDEKELKEATKKEIDEEDENTVYEDISRRDEPPKQKIESPKRIPENGESFYYERVFDESKPEPPREKSVPPPAPPPPPPPKPFRNGTSMERDVSRARSTTPGRAMTPGRATPHRDRKEVKGGIGGFGSDVMDELEEQQRRRQDRGLSAQREMTQSCHPDMAQWKQNEEFDKYDRSATSTPWRAASVGPTMRKLEQVVSRTEPTNNNDENEANFVFRPKIVHSSEQYQQRQAQNQQQQKQQNGYMMGRSVFTPVEEAERMRNQINSKQNHNSHNTAMEYGTVMDRSRSQHRTAPTGQRSQTVGPYQEQYNQYQYNQQQARNPFGSAAYKASPYASHTARRSKTPVAFDRLAEPESAVESTARQWPPASNATGVVTSPRDNWVGQSMQGVDDNGLVTTMCRRVVERKREDNWKWKDENGRLVDEKSNNTWKGELDTLLRDGPNEGRHWSRTVERLPTGDTRFQDVNRQYNRDYVVESIVRNY